MPQASKKITVLASVDISRPVGDTIRVIALCNELASRSFSVKLVVPNPWNAGAAVELHRRVSIETTSATYSRGFVGMIRVLLSLVTYTGKHRLRGWLQVEGTLLGFLAAILLQTKVVIDVHGLLSEEMLHGERLIGRAGSLLLARLLGLLERQAVLKAWKVIVVSSEMKRYLCERWRRPPDSIDVVPNGYFQHLVRHLSCRETDSSWVTFVGQVSAWSGVNRLIEEMDKLRLHGIHLRIVGGGPLLKVIAKNQDASEVTLLGFQPPEEVYRLVASSNLVAAPMEPSAALQVACPIKLLEYMALGKPIVTEDVGEIPSILKSERAGLVVPAGQIAEGLLNLFENPKLQKRLSRRALLVSRRYAWSVQADKLSRIYAEASEIEAN